MTSRYDINVTGWGDLSGFELPADYNETTDVYILSDEAGDYGLNINAEASGTVKVVASVVTSLTMSADNVAAA